MTPTTVGNDGLRALIYIEESRHLKQASEIVAALSALDEAVVGGPGLGTGDVWALRSADATDEVRQARIPTPDRSVWARGKSVLARMNLARSMIVRARADVVVMMEENAGGLTSFVAQAAKELGRPVVIVSDYIPNPEEPAQFHYHDRRHRQRGIAGRILAMIFPTWILSYRGQRLFRLPPLRMLAYYSTGWRSLSPWILNAGYAAALAIDSEIARERYMKLGFSEQKLHVVGNAVSDRLFEGRVARQTQRHQLEDTLGLSPDRPLLICALPPSQYDSVVPGSASGFEFPTYVALLEGWYSVLAEVAAIANVVICPHPRQTLDYAVIWDTPGVRVSKQPIEQLLPLADLFLASASTTIGWALSVGVPVINYDCYRFHYADFSDSAAVDHVFELESCRAALAILTQDPVKMAMVTSEALADSSRWGLVDGRFKERLGVLLAQVASSMPQPWPTHVAVRSNSAFRSWIFGRRYR